jgi:hypothetical protein
MIAYSVPKVIIAIIKTPPYPSFENEYFIFPVIKTTLKIPDGCYK